MPLDQQQWKTSRNASYGRKQAKKSHGRKQVIPAREENKLYKLWKKRPRKGAPTETVNKKVEIVRIK